MLRTYRMYYITGEELVKLAGYAFINISNAMFMLVEYIKCKLLHFGVNKPVRAQLISMIKYITKLQKCVYIFGWDDCVRGRGRFCPGRIYVRGAFLLHSIVMP